MQFGKNLLWLMEKNNLSPERFAEAMHISRSMLNNFTRCIWEPNLALLIRIAAYFQVSTDYLLGYYSKQFANDLEDDLLHAFRSLPPAQQRIFLEQGKAAARACNAHNL